MRTKPLPATYTSSGYLGTITSRDGDVIVAKMVHQTNPSIAARPHWEVCIVQKGPPHPEAADAGDWDQVERIPPASQWGALGWTLLTEEDALEKAEALKARRGAQ